MPKQLTIDSVVVQRVQIVREVLAPTAVPTAAATSTTTPTVTSGGGSVQTVPATATAAPASAAGTWVSVYVEYELRSGSQVIQYLHKNVTLQVPADRRVALATLLDQLTRDVAQVEQI